MLMVLLALVLTGPAVLQEKPAGDLEPPRRGDAVVVRGCLSGGAFDSTEVTGTEQDGKDTPPARYSEFVTFRLTGDKKVLQEIRKDHSGHADVLTGTLGTDLPKPGVLGGRNIGNSRVAVGVGRGMAPEAPPPLPVLKVKSFEHTGVTCR